MSNYRTVREALLLRAPIPATNIHPIPIEGVSWEAAASAYERELKSFPGAAVLAERDRWVAAVFGTRSEARIARTYPAIESGRYTAFPTEGEEKRGDA